MTDAWGRFSCPQASALINGTKGLIITNDNNSQFKKRKIQNALRSG